MFRKTLYAIVIVSLIVASLPAPRSFAAPLRSPSSELGSQSDDLTLYIAPLDSQPLLREIPMDLAPMYEIEATLQQPVGPYRTTVRIRGNADLARLKKLGVTILASTKTDATVIADRAQLENLAKLQFQPRKTELTARLQTASRAPLAATATSAQILAATATDSDNDGLNDTEEGWWCTNANLADSDNDRVNDGDEVNALRDWILHTRATRPASGKPFAGWPPNQTGCYDSDYDSVPDAVEVYVFGLNPNRESTARDKFDDGQKLFGLTNCPGSGGGCGYGALPRAVDWGVIFAEMPTWVKPPYDSPFVAAFPIPEVSVIPSSWKVERVTTITTQQGQMTQTEKTYGSATTRGHSTSVANTVTWNNWEEVSQSIETPVTPKQLVQKPSAPKGFLQDFAWSTGKIFLGGALVIKGAGVCIEGLSGVGLLACVGEVGGGIYMIKEGGDEWAKEIKQKLDEYKRQQKYPACFQNQGNRPSTPNTTNECAFTQSPEILATSMSAQRGEFQTPSQSPSGTWYTTNSNNDLLARELRGISYAISQQRFTETHASGQSWGGAQTTTQEDYEEHTLSESNAFATGENWSTAWATDSSYAANLTFNYTIKNAGSEYAREITGLIFNIYLGDDPNPIISYPAWQQFPNGKLENVFPGDVKTFASTPAVHLTLDQMKRIDLGEKLVVTLADFSYGVDQLFYQDAINSGVTIYVDDGVNDNDELVDQYVLPTWGTENVQEVIARYFPIGMDSDGLMNAMYTPEFNGTTPQWNEHFLSEIAWWNVYLTQADAGNTQLRDLNAQASSALLFRFNRDSDRDGYPDRIELQYGTNKNDPASHPNPEILAGYTIARVGNTVTVKLALQNNGTFDAFGMQAVMYSPDATTTINDNTIGGNGRVRPGAHVAVGSLVKKPTLTNWTNSTAKVYSTGDFTGGADKVYTFTVSIPGVVGSGTTAMNWSDGSASGSLALGSSYHAPLPIAVGSEGLQVGFDTGTILTGESFTVAAYTPRDTFKFTVNNDPYTMPVIVVSYSDMQGSHRFITTREMSALSENLTPYSSSMLRNLSVDIVSQTRFASSGNNTTHLVVNNPHTQTIQNANLYVDIVGGGAVVAHLPYTLTLQAGPTIVPVTWSTATFSPTYNATIDYLMLASWTDSEGNVIDTRARPLSTFDVDPAPVLNTSPATWNIGTVTQGAQPQQTISIVNTGIMPLNVVVNSSDPKLTLSGANGIITVPPAGTTPVVASLDTTTLAGAVSMSLTIRSNDPAHQTVTVPVNGTVSTSAASAFAFDITNRPLDKTVRVYGNVAQFSTVDFTHNFQPDTVTIEPCKVYAADGTTLKGVGKYCADFNAGTASAQVFGDGRDGDLVVTSGMTVYADLVRTNVTASGTTANTGGSTGFAVGDLILFHQSRETANVGRWEFNTITAINSTTNWTLAKPLSYAYDNTNGRAQAIKVRQYRNVTVESGGLITATPWDGWTGGIVVFLANGTTTINGTIVANGTSASNNSFSPGTGTGFSGGTGVHGNQGPATGYQGSGTNGTGIQSGASNGNGGGAGNFTGSGGSACRPGAGGGNGTSGNNAVGGTYGGTSGNGGLAAGTSDLTNMVLGGGGGGAACSDSNPNDWNGMGGGGGGGIIYISSRMMTVSGNIIANGGNGGSRTNVGGYSSGAGGGGGAGGSILIKAQQMTLGTNLITAFGGAGGTGSSSGDPTTGGAGGAGRIRIEYQNITPGWSTNPSASAQQVAFYLAEKPDANTIRYTVPDTVTSPGQNYVMQFARRLAFAGGGNQTSYTRVVSQTYASSTMDALVTNVGAGGATNLRVDINNQTIYSATQTITQPTTINIPNFASAVNEYVISRPISTSVDVPLRVTIDRQADVLLTNLGLTPGAGLDLVVTPSDLVLGCPGGPSCLASEGNTIPITVTVRNTGAQAASSAVVSYYAGNPSAGGRLIDSSYVATIPGGGSTTATFNWNTEGFTRTQTLYAVVDPPNAISETLENNNVVSQTLYIKTKPDLRVASIALSATDRVVGEPITATITISNTGETNAASHYTNFNARGGGYSDNQDLATATIPATNTLTLTRSFAPTVFGTHTITITADSLSTITESVESNNVTTRTVFVGINAQNLDAGGASDAAYTNANGAGYLNGSTFDFGGATITKTVRYDGSGVVQYRFDGLQPGRFYHLDATFYQEGDTFNQLVLFDGADSGRVVPMVDAQPNTLSLLVPATAYSDGSVVVSFQRQSGSAAAPTRFRKAGSSIGPAFVSQVTLTPIEYIYIDAGGASDVAYDAARGYGYLATNTPFASSLGGSEAVNTFRTVFGNTLNYQFSRLNPAKNYLLNLTLYDGASSTRVQGVSVDGSPITACWNLPVNTLQRVQCPIDPAQYTDGVITVGIVCSSCTAPRLNEIALEEKTREQVGSATPSPTPTPTPSAGTNVSAFSAQWSANTVQVNWSTISESKTDKFQVWRSPTINPAAWTAVRTQPSQSNCASTTTPYAYNFTDTTVVAGQTYYYKLTWAGDTCGGQAGAFPNNATAYAYVNTSLLFSSGWNLVSLPISPTITHTASSLANAINNQGGGCTEVDRWYSSGWDSHVIGLPFNDFPIQQGMGYFLKCNKANTWSYQGTGLTQGIPLSLFTGWNLVGVPYAPSAQTAESLTDGMNTQGGNCPEADRWLNGGWDSHLNNVSFNDFAIEANKGYFVKCTQPSAYVPGGSAQAAPRAPLAPKAQRNLKNVPSITQVQVTNLRDTSATISWVTDRAAQGWVNFGTASALGNTAYDDRNALTVATSHHVTLFNLSPNTTYYFDLVSDSTVDNNKGAHYTFKTGAILGLPSSDVIYGQVFKPNSTTPAEGALVYITITDQNKTGTTGTSASLSAVVDRFGYWQANLGNLRQSSSSGYYAYSSNGDTLTIQVDGAGNGWGARSGDTSARAPAPPITLRWMNLPFYFPFVTK
ncbi:MAG: fibronectin type III domain-containing protein [Chloroflexi bacterium]|nr:fibronectin type III domain-containing protein [Chloroflexota bacterium]